MRKVIIIIISPLIKNQVNKDLKQGVGRPNKKKSHKNRTVRVSSENVQLVKKQIN